MALRRANLSTCARIPADRYIAGCLERGHRTQKVIHSSSLALPKACFTKLAVLMNGWGIYNIDQLRAQGFVRRDIDRLVSVGDLRRLSRGWYATSDADPRVAEAIRFRARVGCLTGCDLHGVWVPPTPRSHVLAGSKRLPLLPSHLLWHPWGETQPNQPIFPLQDCLQQVLHRHDAETALICLESAANRRLISVDEATALIASAPVKRRSALRFFDPKAESGVETRVRLYLQRRGVAVDSQVQIPGVGRADLVAGSLVIECDGRRYHSEDDAFDRDRERDLQTMRAGHRWLRLSYSQVFSRWASTQEALSDILQTRRHRSKSKPV